MDNTPSPPMNTLLWGVVGSTAHGLKTPTSDEDTLGVFAASTLEIAGLNWHSNRESVVRHEPDMTFHEIGKYLRLALKANPTVLELLYLDEYKEINTWGKWLIDIRSKFINPFHVKTSYLGYAKSQIERYERNARNGKVERKTARHTLRLVEQGSDILTHGTFSIKVADPQRYFDLNEMPFEDVLKILWDEYESLKSIDENKSPNFYDPHAVSDWLKALRRHYL